MSDTIYVWQQKTEGSFCFLYEVHGYRIISCGAVANPDDLSDELDVNLLRAQKFLPETGEVIYIGSPPPHEELPGDEILDPRIKWKLEEELGITLQYIH